MQYRVRRGFCIFLRALSASVVKCYKKFSNSNRSAFTERPSMRT
jgi:hypothetical protein